ncbi:FadR family transcriptional regulator [Paenibacillus alkaliterrae]|uniref:FadR/GntR family transcriptional regulator n=1 Tax=Paenibacillus alkaliterrae TaxID=320909 RepID=UPI001F250D9B|nr:FadR/GntR family transcriptional regulator [Paenibacillus alkaliterrae]MCF2939229.1 FadR family transcriptional regulator [Paenibacillus alkaliterrae]
MISKKQTLSSIVNERIKQFIVENDLRPGDRLPSEKEMMDKLNVSRTIVREGLKTLQSNGIIEIKPGSGIFVKEVSISDIFEQVSFGMKVDKVKFKEIIDTRIIIEQGAIELAIAHYDVSKIDKLIYWNNEIKGKIEHSIKAKHEDMQFHSALFFATGNETYFQFSKIINAYFDMNDFEKINELSDFKTAYEEHQNIIRYILNKDIHSAKNEMKKHLSPLYHYI